jgi:RNA recognition motif-containing protein
LFSAWAEQQEEPDEETMATVKVLYVKNLKESVTEEQLQELFAPFGEIDKIKKLRDYAFIHYKERDPAIKVIFPHLFNDKVKPRL